MKFLKSIKAYSLIELSIVLLIIGVVTLVVLNGKSLVVKANCVVSTLSSKTITDNLNNPTALTANRSTAYEGCVTSGGGPNINCSGLACTSCKTLLDANPGTNSGTYTIDPDGFGGLASFSAYCNMNNDGGGWTLVVAQYEDSPVTNWNQGINTTTFVAPTAVMLDNCGNVTTSTNGCDQVASAGFVLNTSQIPTHTQTAFGKGSNATFIGYSNFVYTTGDISKTLLTNIKDGNTYHVYRSASGYYAAHDPEHTTFYSAAADSNSLTYDRTGGSLASWAFAPNQTNISNRGYSINGNLEATLESYAWTVWVR